MPELPVGEMADIHKLLLNPIAENVAQVTSRLESVAEEVARIRLELKSGGTADEARRAFLFSVQAETLRVRDLLDKAARFFSGWNTSTEDASYGRYGLLCSVDRPGRALARL